MFGSLPCNAGDMDLIPGRGTGIPHAVQQLSPHTTTHYSNYLYAIRKHYYLYYLFIKRTEKKSLESEDMFKPKLYH